MKNKIKKYLKSDNFAILLLGVILLSGIIVMILGVLLGSDVNILNMFKTN